MRERLVPVDELVTVDDIARRLNVSVNTATNIVRGRDGRYKLPFPRPLKGRDTRAVWLWTEVEAWCKEVALKITRTRRRNNGASGTTPYKRPNWSRGKRTA